MIRRYADIVDQKRHPYMYWLLVYSVYYNISLELGKYAVHTPIEYSDIDIGSMRITTIGGTDKLAVWSVSNLRTEISCDISHGTF